MKQLCPISSLQRKGIWGEGTCKMLHSNELGKCQKRRGTRCGIAGSTKKGMIKTRPGTNLQVNLKAYRETVFNTNPRRYSLAQLCSLLE